MPDIFDAADVKKKTSTAPTKLVSMAKTKKTTTTTETFTTTTDQPVTHRVKTRPVQEYSKVMREESQTRNPLAAFSAMPGGIFFDTQEDDETVLLLLRRHLATQIPWVVTAILLALVPFLFSAIHLLDFLPLRFQTAAALGWYLIILGYALQSFLSWFYNVYIITDQRVIDVDFYNLLYKNISSAQIEKIEDFSTQTEGVFSSIFNYGTITIQTAAAIAEFEFEDVPQPAKVTALLNEIINEKQGDSGDEE